MERVDIIVRGDHVLPMEGRGEVISPGAVAVKDGRIAAVGTDVDIAGAYEAAQTLGGPGRVVMPGLINTHTHAAMVLMRGMADDLPLMQWLQEHIWPAEDHWLGPEFIADAIELACLEMLKAGITTYSDMYFFEGVAAEVTERMGMRAVLGAGILDFPTKTTRDAEDCLRNAEKFIGKWGGSSLITPAVAPHSAYTCSSDTLQKSHALADEHGVPIHIHLSETRWEVDEVRKKHGQTPVAFLQDVGFLSERLIAAHCVWVTPEEIDMLASHGVGVSHCPESNLKLASGIAPVPAMLKAGLKVSLGTDGAASNNDLNIISEISTAAKLHKAATDDPTAIGVGQALLMATLWGAEVLGMGGLTGSLVAGKAADIITIDVRKPHLTPMYNVMSHMVYAVRASDVESVMVNGQVLVYEGVLTAADEGEIIKRASVWGAKLKDAEYRTH